MLIELQESLEDLYRLDPAPKITGFLVPAEGNKREELIIVQEEDLFLGLALDPEVVRRLFDPLLAAGNLQEFCLAVEGVSHFLCVMHRVREERPITILELELQAEVDKYVASLMLAQRCPSLPMEQVHHRLFSAYRLVDGLSPDEEERYQQANTLARRYTRRLDRRFVRRQQLPAMLTELRRFYRMDYWAKQELIQRAA
ncbi:MAG: hypothetical protein IT371_07170 [Deltaproteobacteria bacterium]|nr:hypothetical protein [Deltaproteobacteria bacterium]